MLKTYEEITCPKKNTIFITAEPSSMERYNNNFLKQFGTIITAQQQIKHPNKIYQQILPWSIGTKRRKDKNHKVILDYDMLKTNSPEKTKLISVISSNKSFTKGHKKRLKFINQLKEHLGDKLDIFGAGVNPIPTKWTGIAPYKYHIAIENSSHKYYWTEKLADSFLSEAYPIYYGCSNIHNYFSGKSLTTININKPKQAIKIIEKIIENNQYEKSREEILKAKELVLDKYNIFPAICDIIENRLEDKKNINLGDKVILKMKPESSYSQNPNLLKKIFKSLKYKIKKIRNKIKNKKHG